MTRYPPGLLPLAELQEAVLDIARRAGDLAIGGMARIEGELKEDMTYVTAIDRDVEMFLRHELDQIAPGIGFIGEEYGRHGTDEVAWIVDPIDGTGNLLFGIPLWGISVGLMVGEDSVLGVFHLPLQRETYTARRGAGAFVNGRPIQTRLEAKLHPQDCIGITSDVVNAIDLTRVVGRFRALGSIATEVVYAARGTLYACISFHDKLVDLGAVDCIAREAGCVPTYLSGELFRLREWVENPPRVEPILFGPPWAIRDLRAAFGAEAV